MNGGRGRVLDTSPYVHMTVRYTAVYARPYVGAKLFGVVDLINVVDGD